ncbi:MAG: potassium channel family protein [Lacipirellulaceae bacterium]
MLEFVLVIFGWLIATLGVLETCIAVLYPRAVSGPVTAATYRVYHYVSQKLLGANSRLLLFSGPVLILCQLIVWASLLLLGISLVVRPELGRGIVYASGEAIGTDLATAVYYAGFSVTTLGMGDLVPQTTFTRMVTITASAIGFSFFTLVLAYVISVYSALGRRNQFASEIDYRTGRTGDVLGYLLPHLACDDRSLLQQDLYDLASKLADLLESHHFYPALHYFRFREPRYAMSRMLRFCLETASLLRAINESQDSVSTVNAEPTERLWHASLQMLEDAQKHFVICKVSRDDVDSSLAARLSDHLRSTESAFLAIDPDAFASAYTVNCRQWSNDLRSLERCTMTGSHRPQDSH